MAARKQHSRLMLWLFATMLCVFGIAVHAADYSGSETCNACHQTEYANWLKSHHYQAMLPAGEETVLGDFSGVKFDYAGVTNRFFREDGKYKVETDNEKGELQVFEIAYTFGFDPLQQYLIAFPGGRYQALNIVWDNRPGAAGGQRWVHLYPDQNIDHEDIVHWTGSFQNWNSRCAACHSTNLKKNYAADTNSYRTSWSEINVACEACHGPASDHLSWAAGNRESGNRGFAFSLNDRGPWAPDQVNTNRAANTLTRQDGKHPRGQVEMCAGCHSRRSEMDEDHAGKPFSDLYQLRLLEEGLYFADGQNEDEVYVYGSFLQSKMSQAGVVCSDCHEPHSNSLLAQGNALCTRCHDNGSYNDEAHHHHASESPGASCVNCHMPTRTYMVVDDRHDHSFRVPEPALTQALGTQNTCDQCHLDRDTGWAVTALEEWGVSADIRADHARVLEMARESNAGVLPELLSLANDTSRPGIVRATAILESSRFPSRETLETVLTQLASPDDLIRTAAVRSLDWIPPPQRYQMLQPLISDPTRAVRAEVARQLTEVPIDQVAGEAKGALERLRQEYLEMLELNADMPETQINIAVLHSATGDPLKAEEAYRRSLKLSPTFTPAMLNLADLYRANGMDSRAEPLLLQAIEIAPEQAEAYHALGLLQVRAKQLNEALPNLQRAAELQTYNLRFSYVYAVALYEDGEYDQAIAVLEDALEKHPGNEQLVSALASYYQQRGNLEKLQRLMERYPR